jgi:hypothetical protein
MSDFCCSFFRYHHNVADSRLSQHTEKGNEDGLYISCVASSANHWALVVDAGTGFCSQFMSAHQFSAQGTVLSDLCMAIYVWIITLSRKPKGGFKFYILHRT